MKIKTCPKCSKEKELSEFYKDSFRKDGFRSICKICCKKYRDKNKDRINSNLKMNRKLFPWKVTLSGIKQRCNNPNNKWYYRYGGRGIKNFLNEEQIKFLWFRDKAYLMKKPSIDRKDNDGNYELSNCRFIEYIINSKKDNYKRIQQFDLNNNFVRDWRSITHASKQLKIHKSTIARCCLGKRSYITAGGYIWKYKEQLHA